MASPTIRTVGTASFGTASTLAPAVPTHSADDILLCCIGSSANASVTPTHSMPGDWNLAASNANSSGTTRSRCSVYWKRTAGGESAPTVTFTPTGATACHHSAVIISVQNAMKGADPTDGTNSNQAAGASTLALTLTTAYANEIAFMCAHHADNVATGTTDDNSYTARVDTDNGTGIDGFLSVKSKDQPTSGSGKGGTITFTSGGTGVGIAGVIVALKEALTGSPGGVAVNAAKGTPTAQPGNVTVTATGLSVGVSIGSPTTGQQARPTGLAVAVSIGTPTAQPGGVTRTATGIAVDVAKGTATATSGLSASPTGRAVSVAIGTPTALPGGITCSPSGLAVAASLGTPTATVPTIANVIGLAVVVATGEPLGIHGNFGPGGTAGRRNNFRPWGHRFRP